MCCLNQDATMTHGLPYSLTTIGSWGKDCRLNNMHGKARCGQSFGWFSAKVIQIGQRSFTSFSLSLFLSLPSLFVSFSPFPSLSSLSGGCPVAGHVPFGLLSVSLLTLRA